MAKELSVSHIIGSTVYAVIFARSTGKVWDVGDSALETPGTWNDARAGQCDIALTDIGGGLFCADFPAITTSDVYYILYFEQLGASPDTTDRRIGREQIAWNGTAETVPTTPTAGSGKTLADLRSICYYHGWKDKTTEGIAALDRFINNTLQKLSTLAPWPEYFKRDGRITMATATYAYTATDSLDQSISNIANIGNIYTSDRFCPLEEITLDDWMFLYNTQNSTGQPLKYALRKYATDGSVLMEMLFYPTPTSGENGDYLYYAYKITPNELTLSTDKTDWPTNRLWLLEEALELRIASGKRDNAGVMLEGADFMALVNKAIADCRVSYMPIRIYERIDMRKAGLTDLPIKVIS